MIILAFLQMLDFSLTWIGINDLNTITEGNPLLVFLFDMSFMPALIVRTIQITLLMSLLLFLFNNDKNKYYPVLILGLSVNVYVFYMHIDWIGKYLGI